MLTRDWKDEESANSCVAEHNRMNENITYQEVGNEYCQQVAQLIVDIQVNEFSVPIKLEDQPDLMDIEGTYQRSGGNFWAAFYGDQVIGTIGLIVFSEHEGAIRKMFVDQRFRGKESGVAIHLLTRLIDFGRKKNLTDLYLDTVEMLKAAHRFYERNDFQRILKEQLPPDFPAMAAGTRYYHRAI